MFFPPLISSGSSKARIVSRDEAVHAEIHISYLLFICRFVSRYNFFALVNAQKSLEMIGSFINQNNTIISWKRY